MSQLYVDTIFTGLIPVRPVRRIPPDPEFPGFSTEYEIEVIRTVKAYKKGDHFRAPARYLVEKAGFRGCYQMVRNPVDLDERFEKAEKARQ